MLDMKKDFNGFIILMLALLYSVVIKAQRDESYGWEQAPRYRGFIGESYVFGTGDDSENRSYVYTSHGMELAPGFYLGGGVGAAYWWEMEEWNVPVFVDARLEFHKSLRKNFSPYVATKVGYSFGDINGLYIDPQIGCHFYFGHSKFGISTALGYTYQGRHLDYGLLDKSSNVGGVELSVGLDI